MNTGLLRLFDLRRDQQDADTIDASMRAGAQLAGTNLWVLFFAILIASVGLNVNSTAVIIGAMLISPLMGPIVGMGYGAAVRDLPLIRTAALNLAVFAGLSLLTSALYFALSPLDQPQSELIARTTPTLWDVLIAAFGGAAGMVAVTRKSYSNIVPGVAIATALMPPLCTAGFGAAHGRWDMFGGAFFLFLINGVFIAASTLAVARLMRLPSRGRVEPGVRNMHRLIIGLGLTLVLVPSIWFGYGIVQQEVFRQAAQRVARALEADPHVLSHEIEPQARALRITLVGGADDDRLRQRGEELLAREGQRDTRVVLRRAGDAPLDLGQLRSQLQQDLNRALVQQVQANDLKLKALEAAAQSRPVAAPRPDAAALLAEARAQLPALNALTLAYGDQAAASAPQPAALVLMDLPRPLKPAERQQIERWLAVRLARADFQLIERVQAPRHVAAR